MNGQWTHCDTDDKTWWSSIGIELKKNKKNSFTNIPWDYLAQPKNFSVVRVDLLDEINKNHEWIFNV